MTARRPLIRSISFAALLVGAAMLAGCTDGCAPVEVPTVVSLGMLSEELRTLPILVSGATRIAGEDLPDAHGRMEYVVSVTHPGNTNATLNFTDIDISGLHLSVTVDNKTIPIEIMKVESTSPWTRVGPNSWSGGATSSTRLVLWWKVDVDPARNPLDLVLPEGKPYTASVDFDWTHRDCYAKASGRHSESISDFVQASANAKTFESVGEPRIEVAAGGVGLQADHKIRSGLNVTIRSIEAHAVRIGPPPVAAAANTTGNITASPTGVGVGLDTNVQVSVPTAALGLVAFPKLNTFVDGNATQKISPAKTMRVQSTAATSQAYATSGTMLPAPFDDGPAVYVLIIEITYLPDDPTQGVTTDILAHAIVHT